MEKGKKIFFKKIYADNKDRLDNKRNIRRDLIQWEKNESLRLEEEEIENNLKGNTKQFKKIFIVGTPRSGSTFLSQLLHQHLSLAAPYNKMAKYYMVPLYGFDTTTKLKESPEFNFKSNLGNTQGENNLHEFGYFWQYHLKYTESDEPDDELLNQVNWKNLNKKLSDITLYFKKPLLVKNQVYINFIIDRIYKEICNSCFINIKRNSADTIYSIYNARLRVYGSDLKWWSIKPKDYKSWLSLDSIDQITHQVLYTRQKIEKQLKDLNSQNFISITYADLLNNPTIELKKVGDLIGQKLHNSRSIKESIQKSDHKIDNMMRDKIERSIKKINSLYS
jgi:hypothetical protein